MYDWKSRGPDGLFDIGRRVIALELTFNLLHHLLEMMKRNCASSRFGYSRHSSPRVCFLNDEIAYIQSHNDYEIRDLLWDRWKCNLSLIVPKPNERDLVKSLPNSTVKNY